MLDAIALGEGLAGGIFQLDRLLMAARDRFFVPIYATKGRIKTPDSVYLKTKRRNLASHLEITDVIGFRVLCLFQHDIFSVHSFLNELFFKTEQCCRELCQESSLQLVLKELNIYTWPTEESNRIRESTKSSFKSAIQSPQECRWELRETQSGREGKLEYISPSDRRVCTLMTRESYKTSGYKAIHYVGTLNDLNLEIQLRTLVQDVWGELEHKLIYKQGHIHPHLAETSRLVARSLENTDNLMNHLREIREQQRQGERFGSSRRGPFYCFDYDDGFFDLFAFSDESKRILQEYWALIKNNVSNDHEVVFVDEALRLLCLLEACIEKCPQAEYFLRMEKAYLKFCQGKYDDAENIYKEMLGRNLELADKYVLHFRLGELRFLGG